MKKILLAIVLIIIIIYSLCYLIFPEEIVLLQVKKENLSIDNLLSKQPIIIENKINREYIDKIFKFNLISKIKKNNIWNRTNNKYTLFFAKNDTTIFISNPKKIKYEEPTKNDIVIEIKIKKDQSLILPYKWYYSLDNKNQIIKYGIHDYITYIYNIIFSFF
jgi:hypothetical protein|uniref:Uncharacterized protein n=1 Tax=viral metagenome TaxID=1070528 RepID=A0A6C0JNX4_9ZZZZ